MLERPKTAGKVYLLPVEQIEPSPHQARRTFDEKELARLAVSILEHGLLQPVTVQRLGKNRYRLVAGERRLRACRMANLAVIPALLCEADEQGAAALGLVENLQRQPLDPFEQARGIREMIALWDCTQEEAARHLGMAQPTLANKLRLLALTEEQQKFVTGKRPDRAPRPGGAAFAGGGPHPGAGTDGGKGTECPAGGRAGGRAAGRTPKKTPPAPPHYGAGRAGVCKHH